MKKLALTAIICGASILGINATTHAAIISSAVPATKIETQQLGVNWGNILGSALLAGLLIAADDGISGSTSGGDEVVDEGGEVVDDEYDDGYRDDY